eukprot:CAMPEP_0181383396 /NCGR_PEP_ID=MMETSP1106-20121128/21328_1 /TAXON_ID=81844 /ORGANISM="Mantoniella antarctica, Strain SL-175" /LENGTH=126 /DNA_ID=CAMNT_0023503035 /DNA_START=136 /DNA_END=512 /DNA_ORIENTATION=+
MADAGSTGGAGARHASTLSSFGGNHRAASYATPAHTREGVPGFGEQGHQAKRQRMSALVTPELFDERRHALGERTSWDGPSFPDARHSGHLGAASPRPRFAMSVWAGPGGQRQVAGALPGDRGAAG